jgi:DNA-binding LacI/PurR family transcriptional regulator
MKRVDLAQKLGLNVSTVSRVLNGRQGISAETRKRVLEAAEQEMQGKCNSAHSLGFRPGRNGITYVGAVFPLVKVPFFGHILQGLEDVSYDSAANTLVSSSNYQLQRERRVIERQISSGVSGIVLWSIATDTNHLEDLLRPEIPVVAIDHDLKCQNHELGSVVFDDAEGAEHVANYLLDLGHERIGFIAPHPRYAGFSTTQTRMTAFRETMAKRDLDDDAFEICYTEPPDYGYSATIRLLRMENAPTAIFLNDDDMASRAYSAIRELGLAPGKDIAVIGFGDQPIASQLEVPLTTIKQDLNALGRHAGEMLIQRIQNPLHKLEKIVLPAPLIVRQSCCPPKKVEQWVQAI